MARLKEQPGQVPTAQAMVTNLLQDHEAIIRQLRMDIEATGGSYHDAGTSDFLTGVMEAHEKMAWMLRAQAGA
jgi:starvation-inducible DNA-binding protein